MATKYDRQVRKLEDAGKRLQVEICPFSSRDDNPAREAWLASATERNVIVIRAEAANL